MRRLFCSVSVPILCSLFLLAAPSAHAQKKVTVTAELKRLQGEGADPAAIAGYRATYTDARARVKRLGRLPFLESLNRDTLAAAMQANFQKSDFA